MEFDAVLIAPRRAQSVAQGFWHNRTINDDLDACVANCPDKLALTAVQAESGTVTRFTYRELAAMADRVAAGLARLAVGRNDIVACQLPNWWQFTVTYLACSRIGAVMNPLMHIFRERELSFMLKHGANSFEALLSGPAWELSGEADAILSTDRPGPDDVTQLIYTSGTTGEPKGVMHTANTVMANIIPYAQRLHLGERDVVLMASPMPHQTGFMYGLMMPIMLKASAILLDIWEPLKAIDLIRTESATFTMASTPFLTDLAKNVADSGKTVPTLATFLCAGAPIPGPLVEQARAVLGTKIVSAWGMTENGAVTLIKLDDDDERAFTTDGCPLPGVELKVIWPARPAAAARLLQLRRVPQAAAVERHRCRRLVRHRRPGLYRRTGLCPYHGPQQGRDHPRRRKHSRGRDRGAVVPPPGDCDGGDRGLPR